jgi:DNA-binding GntR family transcriptional regulator
VLFRLSQELIVDLHPNRGAFIASPTRDDMRDVFQVRQALERGVVLHLCRTSPHPRVPALQSHLELEAQARARGDSQALAKLTGEFHLRLAEATGNRQFADNLRRLQLAAQRHRQLLFVMRPLSVRDQASPARLRLMLEAAKVFKQHVTTVAETGRMQQVQIQRDRTLLQKAGHWARSHL